MTTTPTASPELLDLDKLEALARAADQSEGQHIYTNPRDSNGWQANEAWHRAASPAAMLALIALARRAQPASDATQTACTVPPEGWYCTRAPGHDGPCAAWPVAQQDAAPSNSPEIPDGSTSAPGTPEAPAEDADGAALRLALKHNMLIDLGRGGCHVRFGDRTPANSVTELGDRRSATRIAIQRAAQLDGGQEGSESNG